MTNIARKEHMHRNVLVDDQNPAKKREGHIDFSRLRNEIGMRSLVPRERN